MAGLDGVLEVRGMFRPCMVAGRKHLFHRWMERRWLVDASPLKGGHPGGLCAMTMALVEDERGQIREVYPREVHFLDTQQQMADFEICYHRGEVEFDPIYYREEVKEDG